MSTKRTVLGWFGWVGISLVAGQVGSMLISALIVMFGRIRTLAGVLLVPYILWAELLVKREA